MALESTRHTKDGTQRHEKETLKPREQTDIHYVSAQSTAVADEYSDIRMLRDKEKER